MSDLKDTNNCEKQPLVEDEAVSQPIVHQPLTLRERLSYFIPAVLLLLYVSILLRKTLIGVQTFPGEVCTYDVWKGEDDEWEDVNRTKVALEAHVMSKCPDAQYCMNELIVPAMSRVSNIVDFKLSFIGTLEPGTDDVHCMHGPSECLGNIIELCVAKHYPQPIIYLPFANCMFAQYSRIPDQDLVRSCALEHGVDFHQINSCISHEREGVQLLRDSVKHSQEVGVSTSCTVRLENEVFCVRDGGEWKNCPGGSSVPDLVFGIQDVYRKKNAI